MTLAATFPTALTKSIRPESSGSSCEWPAQLVSHFPYHLSYLICSDSSVMFREYLKSLESHRRCQSLNIQSFLLLPVQRITRMPLLILAVLNRTRMDHPDHGLVERTLRTFQNVEYLLLANTCVNVNSALSPFPSLLSFGCLLPSLSSPLSNTPLPLLPLHLLHVPVPLSLFYNVSASSYPPLVYHFSSVTLLSPPSFSYNWSPSCSFVSLLCHSCLSSPLFPSLISFFYFPSHSLSFSCVVSIAPISFLPCSSLLLDSILLTPLSILYMQIVTACNNGARQMERTEELHHVCQKLEFGKMKVVYFALTDKFSYNSWHGRQ